MFQPAYNPLTYYFQSDRRALENFLLRSAFLNLIVVSMIGLMLRSFPFISIPLDYKFLLHGHSHFAFSGWIMPVFMWLIIRYLPSLSEKVAAVHWRNITIINLIAAYGMLASFPFQGYGIISITFSTLAVAAGYYLAIVLLKASRDLNDVSIRFLRAGLFFMSVSAFGAIATGPIIAAGFQGKPIYYNAIYFYLHFQYNGWFTFLILSILYSIIEKNGIKHNGNKIFAILTISCVPAYFLSILWCRPHMIFYIVGGISGIIQLAVLPYLIKDVMKLKMKRQISTLIYLCTGIFTVKIVMQLAGSIPVISDLAYQNRDLLIAYLHFVLLGFISLMSITFVLNKITLTYDWMFKTAIYFFLFSFATTEILLVLKSVSLHIYLYADFQLLLLLFSIPFPLAAGIMFYQALGKAKPVYLVL